MRESEGARGVGGNMIAAAIIRALAAKAPLYDRSKPLSAAEIRKNSAIEEQKIFVSDAVAAAATNDEPRRARQRLVQRRRHEKMRRAQVFGRVWMRRARVKSAIDESDCGRR